MKNEFYLFVQDILKNKNISEKTKKQYTYFITQFLENLKEKNQKIEDIDEKNLEYFLDEKFKDKTLNTKKLALKSVLKLYSFLNKKIDVSEIKLNYFNEEKKQELLTQDEISRLIRCANTEKSKLIICLLYSANLKCNQLITLKKEDFDFDNHEGKIILKNGKIKNFLLNDEISKRIKEYTFNQKNRYNFYLFSKDKPLTSRNIQKIVKNTAIKAGINKKVTPEIIRKSYSDHLIKNGVTKKDLLNLNKNRLIKNPIDEILI